MSSKSRELVELLTPVVESVGLELLGIEYAPSTSGAMLRIYIDVADRQVGIEDCETVSREVSALMDVEDPISTEYTLEVSSPGIDRPLFTPAQFQRFVGEEAKVSLRLPQDGRRRLLGRIAKVDGEMITIAEEKGEFVVAHENIDKARLVPDLVALGLVTTKPGKSPRSGKAAKPAGEPKKA
ncbi:ribosome maturation factor RimP [Alkalisalibacterium limincola]|uniref:Ribosome maturation factor RimP n=1 Tax=Alkalisalibacterium limincola TaxID=2699169 RepID=A0A5C8KXE2_9GAMM|nr:ribosome maturation factor RimP [Alkalisalibacterium limincola]TXK65738.1 ribosome maturation factor RimP [Alkalisalibacterium limincola]